MHTIKLQQRGTLTLPKKIRESLKLTEGEVLTVTTKDGQIVLERPSSSDTALLYDIKQSLNDIKRGKFIEFKSVPEFKKKLKRYDAD